MREYLSKILIEVFFFALAFAAKVDFNENNREMHIASRWLKKEQGKKKSVKSKVSTKSPIKLVMGTLQPRKVSMKTPLQPLKKAAQPIKSPILAPTSAKCGTYNLGIVSYWDTTDACWDKCLEKATYTSIYSNTCQSGTMMHVCNKDFIKVSYYENWNCTGAEYVANITKEIQCDSLYYDNSSVAYWNWKCYYNIN